MNMDNHSYAETLPEFDICHIKEENEESRNSHLPPELDNFYIKEEIEESKNSHLPAQEQYTRLPRYPEGPYTNKKKTNKLCFVPNCDNTLYNTEKLFIIVPQNIKARKQWFLKAKRPCDVSKSTKFYACEDHFDVENDIENFLALKMGFESRMKLKPNVFPRFFQCQVDRPVVHASSKFEKKRKLENSMSCSSSSTPEPEINLSEKVLKDVSTQTLLLKTKNVGIQFNVNKTFGRLKKVMTDPITKKDQATSTQAQLRESDSSSTSDENSAFLPHSTTFFSNMIKRFNT